MNHLTGLQKAAFFIAGLALVSGLSFIIGLSGREKPVLDRVPPDIIERGRAGQEEILRRSPSASGGVVVAPSETFIKGVDPGLTLPQIAVVNRSLKEQFIQIDFIPVKRFFVSGAPVIEKTKRLEKEGQKLVLLSQKRLRLKPGQSGLVSAKLLSRPENGVIAGSIGVTVLDQNPSIFQARKNDVNYQIQNNLRINSMLYAIFAGEENSFAVQRLRGFADPENDKSIDLAIRVKGEQGISSPAGTLTVTDSRGQIIAKRQIQPGQRVVAGSEQDIGISAPVVNLKPGDYQAVATVTSNNRPAQIARWQFTIDRNGTLPTPRVEVFLEAKPNYLKKNQKFKVFLQVENSGTKPIGPKGTLKLYQLGKEEVIEELPISIDPMNPGDVSELEEGFVAPKKSGNYEVLLSLESEDGSFLEQRVASVLVKKDQPKPPGPFIKFRDWLSFRPLAGLGIGMAIFGIALGVLTGLIVVLQRRK